MSQSQHVEEFLGLGFHTGTLEEAAHGILSHDHRAPFRYVVTPNVQHMVMLLENPDALAHLYESAWRVFCDSRVLSRLARLFGRRLPVVTGSDLTARLLQQAEAARLKVAVIGPSTGDCARLKARYPRLDIAYHTPPMGFIDHPAATQACIDFVVRERAALTFIAVGMPRQEMLASRIAARPDAVGIGLCVGASIDFLTGKQQRAPEWMQKAGFEWLHRLVSDPVRLASRYLIESPKIFFFVLRAR
jgi:exopolysaccharide biosynthesis WecB/TagA/CpsF family protein